MRTVWTSRCRQNAGRVRSRVLTAVPDRRDPRGVVHALPAVLATAVAAVLTGTRSAAAAAERAADAPQQVLAELGVLRYPFTGGHPAPDESTFRRILTGVDADSLDDTVGRWALLSGHRATGDGRRAYSMDGKPCVARSKKLHLSIL
jgi:hypothetical protein